MPDAAFKAHEPGSRALYRKLRPRPHGPSPDVVVGNQRARLFGATIEAVAVHGYAATSVAELSRLAGVSKRTFYEQFDNKQACFLATYDRVTACAIERIASAQRSEADWHAGLRRAFEEFAHAAAEQPNAARLALVEAPGAGPAALARTDGARRAFERTVVAGFDEAPYGVALPPAVVKGIVCGIERVVRRSLLDGNEHESPVLAGELAAWALSYGSPAVAGLSVPTTVRRDRPGAVRPGVRARAAGERARILRAAAEIAAGGGYARLTPTQIVDRAGVSEQAFQACFDSAEQCFLDALDFVGLEALTSAAAASRAAGDGLKGAYRGVAALMDHIAEDPVLRGLVLVDTFAVGSAAVERRERLLLRFADFLATRLPASLQPPGVVAEAIVGALWGIIQHQVARGMAHQLPELTGQAAYVALAPVVGAELAMRTIIAEQRARQDGAEAG